MYNNRYVAELSISEVKEYYDILREKKELTHEEIADFGICKERFIVYAYKKINETNVLNKIKAEIKDEAEYAYADFDMYKEDILYSEPDELPDDDYRYGLLRAIEIINKYRIEREAEECEQE